jgi:RNA polymerase sigma factor (sigma-70 family)
MQEYLDDLAKIPLLTRQEELQLAKKINSRTLEVREFARHELVRRNLRLVVSIAKYFTRSGIPLEDLISAGNFGLFKAIKKFRWKLGYRFSTYAAPWIKQSISYWIKDNSKLIRQPHYIQDIKTKVSKMSGSTSEISKILGIKESKIRAALASPPEYLDEKHQLIAKPEVFNQDEIQNLKTALKFLNPQEREIIDLRYLKNNLTLKEIGIQLGVTRQYIQQVEAKAFKKLKKILQ